MRNLAGPFLVGLHDLQGVLAPDDSVAGADHVHGQVEGQELVDLLQHQVAERGQDVGVVLQRLLLQLHLVDLVVEAQAGGIVLAKGVVGHEDALAPTHT